MGAQYHSYIFILLNMYDWIKEEKIFVLTYKNALLYLCLVHFCAYY